MGGANYELSWQFLVENYSGVFRASLLRFCAFVLLVLLRTVLESLRNSGGLLESDHWLG